MESRATDKIFKTRISGEWVGMDNTEESSGLTDIGQTMQEAGWS